MAPLPTIEDTFRTAWNWRIGSQTAVNVIHFHDDLGNQTSANLFADIALNVTHDMWDSVVAFGRADDIDITPLDGAGATQTFPTVDIDKWRGGGGSEFAPAVATIVKLTSDFRGKSKNGRIFLPFTAESKMANGTLVSPTAQTAAWVAFANAMIAVGWHLCVASYLLASQVPVANLAVESTLATQRRRQTRLRV